MTSVITGDIINTRSKQDQNIWLIPMQELLNTWGESPKVWEIYRGDSFQVEIQDAEKSLLSAIKIKARIKQLDGIDVRMAVGVGEKTFEGETITTSNGPVFIHSGETFDRLVKDKRTLVVKTEWDKFDEAINIMLSLALKQMDSWTPLMAEIVWASVNNPGKTQAEIAEIIGKKRQSYISEGRKRALYEEIMQMEQYYAKHIHEIMQCQ